jgi:hypothetical protein
MKRLTQDELESVHRIFNRVVSIVGNKHKGYHTKKTLEDSREFVSGNRWIMFPVANIMSLREGVESPTPNVYISFPDEITDDGKGNVIDGWIGLTYNNSGAMVWLNQLLTKRNSSAFLKIVNDLNQDWTVEVSKKIKLNHRDTVPVYETVTREPADKATLQSITNSIKLSDSALYHRDSIHPDGIVQWSITNFQFWKGTVTDTFQDDVVKCFDTFFAALNLR